MHELARAVIIDQGYILLCRSTTHKHQFYFLLGGHVEQGETAEEAVLRELQEETGESFVIDRSLGDFEYHFVPVSMQKACHTHEKNIIFEAHSANIKFDKPLVQQEEHIELVWIPLVQLGTIELKPEKLKGLIKKWKGFIDAV